MEIKKSQIVKIYDGDTLYIDLDYEAPDILIKSIGIRIKGIDTPEIKTKNLEEKKQGIRSREALKKYINDANKIIFKDIERDKYFRLLAKLEINGRDIAEIMINEGFGKEYYGGKKEKFK